MLLLIRGWKFNVSQYVKTNAFKYREITFKIPVSNVCELLFSDIQVIKHNICVSFIELIQYSISMFINHCLIIIEVSIMQIACLIISK